jgi:hypothetical protein
MGHATIPEPTNTDYSVALSAGVLRAEALGMCPATDRKLLQLLTDSAEVHAQMAAELRWLHNMNHPENHNR